MILKSQFVKVFVTGLEFGKCNQEYLLGLDCFFIITSCLKTKSRYTSANVSSFNLVVILAIQLLVTLKSELFIINLNFQGIKNPINSMQIHETRILKM